MMEPPAGTLGSFGEVSPMTLESRMSSVAHLIDIEQAVWESDYRRWTIAKLS